MGEVGAVPAGQRSRKRAPIVPGSAIDRLILEALGKTPVPLSAYALAERLEQHRGLRSVMPIYRSLERLCERKVVERVETASAYRLRDIAKALILLCSQCGCASALAIDRDYDRLRVLIAGADFAADRLVLEATGVCVTCRTRSGGLQGGLSAGLD